MAMDERKITAAELALLQEVRTEPLMEHDEGIVAAFPL